MWHAGFSMNIIIIHVQTPQSYGRTATDYYYQIIIIVCSSWLNWYCISDTVNIHKYHIILSTILSRNLSDKYQARSVPCAADLHASGYSVYFIICISPLYSDCKCNTVWVILLFCSNKTPELSCPIQSVCICTSNAVFVLLKLPLWVLNTFAVIMATVKLW